MMDGVDDRVTEDISYQGPKLKGKKIIIDGPFVRERLQDFDPVKSTNLSRYIL